MSKNNPYNLTDKQLRFCQEYMIDLNATQAAIRAGYSEKTANEQGSQNLVKLSVQNYIAELKNKTSEKLEITHDELLKMWKDLAISDISEIHKNWIELEEFEKLKKEKPHLLKAIESIDTKTETKVRVTYDNGEKNTEDYEVKYVKIKMYNKMKAMEEIGKHIGFYEKDNEQKKNELVKIDLSRLSYNELQEIIKKDSK